MKRLVSLCAVFALVLSLAAVAAAEEKKAEPMKATAAAPAAAAEPAKKAPAKTAAAKKSPKAHQLTGTVEAVDAAAGTLSVSGKKGSVSLKAGEKVSLDKIAVGDKVLVIYSGDTASSVKMVPAKKAGKKMAKKGPKKEAAAPAAPAAPATPASPEKK